MTGWKKWLGLGALILGLIALVALPIVFSQEGKTKDLKFRWEQPGDVTDLAGWRLYYGTASGHYTDSGTLWPKVPPDAETEMTYTNSYTLTITPDVSGPVTYYFVLTAVDTTGNESAFSNEVSIKIDMAAPGVPQNFRLVIETAKSGTGSLTDAVLSLFK